MLNPAMALQIPTRGTLYQVMNDMYNQLFRNLLFDHDPTTKVSLAVDNWTSPNNLAFMAINGYYITKDWEYREHLLGFESLEGAHTGKNMAEILQQSLAAWRLESNLLAITSDNASNNGTMRAHLTHQLRPALQQLNKTTDWDAESGTIPCLAHVIQLVVRELVCNLKIQPDNDALPTTFDESSITDDLASTDTFANTLRKIRLVANATNASPQLAARFREYQQENQRKMIQDVRTRWNSTYEMCVRALLLRQAVDLWIQDSSPKYQRLRLLDHDWKQLEYMVGLLQPFSRFTKVLSKTTGPTIHLVWATYNHLFQHLEREEDKAQQLTTRENIQEAIKAANLKFQKYYGDTEHPKGELLAVAAALHPSRRMRAYDSEDWTSDERETYRQYILRFYKKHYEKYEQPREVILDVNDDIEQMIFERPHQRRANFQNEMERYLNDENLTSPRAPILEQWRMLEPDFPTVARMARDILAIPLTGVGVERVFNVARDTCHYRRSRLHASTIKKIMLLKHGDKVHMLDEALISHEELAKEVIQDNQDDQDTPEIVREEIASLLNPLLNPDEEQEIRQRYQ
ncbi:hypothetical protein D8B26_007053 [Coccidioides posadasii str. Silveira]|nr:hypothetical protein D8B26_007053 [Coccidioides posadasii str. Silveira]